MQNAKHTQLLPFQTESILSTRSYQKILKSITNYVTAGCGKQGPWPPQILLGIEKRTEAEIYNQVIVSPHIFEPSAASDYCVNFLIKLFTSTYLGYDLHDHL